ncbi:MAG: glutamate-semialdehyde -aminomutase [Chthoniobacter sp.]|jgi:glutamate-1-semialdehyde 2,1-aminomutase|nr:glutamate-semialdehyde -aminomutase [Chthoniobacter sp.]
MLREQSSSAFARAKRRIPGGVNSPVRAFRGVGGEPFFVDRAQGARIWDVDGNEYIDYVGTWGPAILGHAPGVVLDGVKQTAERGVSFGIPNPLEIEMAELICEWMPSIEKVRMVNSGTEATMSCVRLARGFTGRDKIVKFDGCYHGHVDSLLVKAGSGALTHGEPDSAGIPRALADLTITLPFNDPQAVRSVFMAEGSKIAAVILEPIPANAGLYFPREGFLDLLRQQCSEYGALLIFDEVMTGFRVARGGAQEVYGVEPDLTALGKVIGGGLPVGAFGGRAEIMDQLSPDGPVYQAGTLSGNPLAMAAGLAQLHELERLNGWEKLEQLGAMLESATRETLKKTGANFNFHRVGSMFCLFFTKGEIHNLADARRSDCAAFAKYFHACLNNGVYFAPSQFETGFLSLAHTEADLARTASVVNAALATLP